MLLSYGLSLLESLRRRGCGGDAGVEKRLLDADKATADNEFDNGAAPHDNAWPCDLNEKLKRARVDSSLSEASTTCSCMSLESDGTRAPTASCEGNDEEAIEPACASTGAPAPQRTTAGQPCELTIRACSWNLNGKGVDGQEDLNSWLEGGLADVLVVGVQELIELKPRSVLRGRSGNRNGRAAFEERIEGTISRQGSYKKVCSYGLVGLAIFVYVREDLVPLIGNLQMKSVKTGFGGALGNKGAVCARFRIGSFDACFVNVHLASGTGKANKRDKHMSKIIAQSVNQGIQYRARRFARVSAAGATGGCHFTAILGDFNSRLELGPEVPLTKGCEGAMTAGARPSEVPLEDWLCKDEMVNGRLESLNGFSEGPVLFPPTFGYVPGSEAFGRRYHPAWTDRVVYRAAAGARAELQEYGAFPGVLRTSDHRPVAAQFKVSFEC